MRDVWRTALRFTEKHKTTRGKPQKKKEKEENPRNTGGIAKAIH